jgi:DNA end-binding protein Ku
MRPIFSGVLSFGLINIPIKVYSATAGVEMDLRMLHKTDLSPIRYAKICRKDGKEIAMGDIVKGYEYQEGDYVVLTEDDFKAANVKRTEAIDVVDFVKESEIDTIYFEKPYYLEPDKGAGKAYSILLESLRKARKVGVAKFVFHNREHLGIIKPHANLIVLEQMRFEDEVKAPEKLNLPKHETIRSKELTMAMSLIDHLTEKFDIGDYHDSYRKELEALIKNKIKGHKPVKIDKGEAPHPTKSADLMTLLKASLEKANSRPMQI